MTNEISAWKSRQPAGVRYGRTGALRQALEAAVRWRCMSANPAKGGGVLNLNNWRNRTWIPAVKASEIATPARIYDLRSTFASTALAAGISVFELGRIMGTSVDMIERHYGTLLDGAGDGIANRLAAFENEQDRAAESV